MIPPADGGGSLPIPLSAPQRTDNSQYNFETLFT
jgi:hypothetical protein